VSKTIYRLFSSNDAGQGIYVELQRKFHHCKNVLYPGAIQAVKLKPKTGLTMFYGVNESTLLILFYSFYRYQTWNAGNPA